MKHQSNPACMNYHFSVTLSQSLENHENVGNDTVYGRRRPRHILPNSVIVTARGSLIMSLSVKPMV